MMPVPLVMSSASAHTEHVAHIGQPRDGRSYSLLHRCCPRSRSCNCWLSFFILRHLVKDTGLRSYPHP